MSNFNLSDSTRMATVILRNFPRDVRDHFKAYAAKRGRSMKELVVGFMSTCIASEKSESRKRKGRK